MSFYNTNAQDFFAGTVDVDMSSLYEKFVPLLPSHASVLDAGCGSGRDSRYFSQCGFKVDAFDASEELVSLAKLHSAIDVQLCTFIDYQSTHLYDGIWACASLLHVPKSELPRTFKHLASLLKSGGFFYCSFKYGDDEVERDGRRFSNLNEDALSTLLLCSKLTAKELWLTSDLRPGRENEKWLNAILIKA
ncbi:SAM-dependent methyltransferase [Vibrio panuliri]|uniref:SAM-dependent methyltransferase n=1 Tax=Vibrio panuliri TaxID=1381081 RepID=A0A1Q9HEA3_9VIBR|nr:class I SAM-dependent methyltransferase [Vibrio panuliri]OLQ88038.1 SAM-dependent methyltransferase [Vibrio panuliri]